jgi:prophage regulatory protein
VLPETGFVRIKDICGDRKNGIYGLIPIAPSSWWLGVKSGKYPQPIKLGAKTTVWRVEDIRALIENGVSERGAA